MGAGRSEARALWFEGEKVWIVREGGREMCWRAGKGCEGKASEGSVRVGSWFGHWHWLLLEPCVMYVHARRMVGLRSYSGVVR